MAGSFRFRVSDVMRVPLRGIVLRLRLVDGAPAVDAVGVGSRLKLHAPDGAAYEVTIKAHAAMGGVPSQRRLERIRELDVLIGNGAAEAPIEIGWIASGPVS